MNTNARPAIQTLSHDTLRLPRLVLVGLVLLASAQHLTAEPLTPDSETPRGPWHNAPQDAQPSPSQVTAKTWLNLQASGKHASPTRQTLSGAALERIHRKFLNQLSESSVGSKQSGSTSKGEAGSDGASGSK